MPITGIATGVHYTWNILNVVLNRTGTFMAMENFGVRADIVCMAKALGAGLPLGATLSSSSIMDWPPGTHSNTFGCIACCFEFHGAGRYWNPG